MCRVGVPGEGSFTTTGGCGRLDAGVKEEGGGRGGKIILKGGTRAARHEVRTETRGGPQVKPLQQMAAAPHGGRQRGGSGERPSKKCSAPPYKVSGTGRTTLQAAATATAAS
ncbi:hypothetical protein E2C01_077860 [Portunus trituberculatus]|uniref:Uncharacterized protein n=1 Tax=Portunus trituberculatus TaxID=210409 RepID=A0A5B7ISL2_PORTR|nr:hypothetical protein [Portunus trituberculatus]